MYQIVKFKFGNTDIESIQRISDEAWIPADERNGDYRAYLAWLAEGNVPTIVNR